MSTRHPGTKRAGDEDAPPEAPRASGRRQLESKTPTCDLVGKLEPQSAPRAEQRGRGEVSYKGGCGSWEWYQPARPERETTREGASRESRESADDESPT